MKGERRSGTGSRLHSTVKTTNAKGDGPGRSLRYWNISFSVDIIVNCSVQSPWAQCFPSCEKQLPPRKKRNIMGELVFLVFCSRRSFHQEATNHRNIFQSNRRVANRIERKNTPRLNFSFHYFRLFMKFRLVEKRSELFEAVTSLADDFAGRMAVKFV